MTERIGFIGVGMMGHGMAKNLMEKGYPVAVMGHRNRGPIDSLVAKGATEGKTPAEIVSQSDIVILCVTGSPQVETVVYGENGILESAHDGLVIIDCTTAEPESTLRIADDLAKKGVRLADAPLARSPVDAEAGRLNTMVGAPDDLFARIKPVLECFCENIFHVGATGNGHRIKLIYNFMSQGYIAMLSEALCACAATGIELEDFYDLMTAGGTNCGIFQMVVPKAIREGDYTGLSFSLANARKDLHYFTRMTDTAQLSGTIGHAIHNVLVTGMNLGFEDKLVGSLIEAQSKLNGVDIVKS
jgi:3-hydroxyisobutyrate dehydrogenase-like beta-hydroxyacid dehydrogenase